jgi:hypothetical protein
VVVVDRLETVVVPPLEEQGDQVAVVLGVPLLVQVLQDKVMPEARA